MSMWVKYQRTCCVGRGHTRSRFATSHSGALDDPLPPARLLRGFSKSSHLRGLDSLRQSLEYRRACAAASVPVTCTSAARNTVEKEDDHKTHLRNKTRDSQNVPVVTRGATIRIIDGVFCSCTGESTRKDETLLEEKGTRAEVRLTRLTSAVSSHQHQPSPAASASPAFLP